MCRSIVVFLTLAMFLVGSSVAFSASHEEGEANPCNPDAEADEHNEGAFCKTVESWGIIEDKGLT